MSYQLRSSIISASLGWMVAGLLAISTAIAAEPDSKNVTADEAAGVWLGNLDLGAIKLRLGVTIQAALDGQLSGSLTSVDQGNATMPIDTIILDGDRLGLEFKKIKSRFQGSFDAQRNEITGQFKQGPQTFPLTLKRVASLPDVKRPQMPKKPYPYREEEVVFHNSKHDVSLAGALTIPPGSGPFSAVVLITGSGPQDRDEAIMGHRPFLVLADYLARHGIAALRFDDRGFGKSTGDFAKANSEDFAEDVRAGVEFLTSRPEIDASKIGLIGHSEGGLIAPMLAVQSKSVAFIVLLAGPGVPGDQILLSQFEILAKHTGVDDVKMRQTLQLRKRMMAVIKEVKDDSAAIEKLVEILKEMASIDNQNATAINEKVYQAQAMALLTPWFRFFIAYDPRPTLSKVTCPVLAVIGEKDAQVAPELNLPMLEAALKEGGNRDFLVKELAGLNHLLQHCDTGMPDEYSRIEETLSADALKLIGDWISQRTSK